MEAHLCHAHQSARALFCLLCRIAELEDERDRLRETLEFYADPDTYFAIGFWPDAPCGLFVEDFEEVPDPCQGGMVPRPGKRARAALNPPAEEGA